MTTPRKLIIFSSLVLALFTLAACGEKNETVVVVGRSLELHASPPEIVDTVAFSDSSGAHRVIRPRASNRQLAVVKLNVVNRTALVTSLFLDEDAARLGDRRGERIGALDPFKSSTIVDAATPEEDMYTPFLRGEVVLDRNFQVEGYLVFDVPKGLILGSLFWDEVDAMVLDYVDYTSRRL